jgi:RNA polymerase sigma-70 factor (ECF subfamily)
MLGQREDAEDATQETFVRVVRNLHHWDSERPFEPWLLTIAGNRCRTKLAKRMKQPTPLSLDYPVQDPRQAFDNGGLLSEEVDLVLCDLRPEYRLAFQLFHNYELGYSEIAERLQVPIGTIKTWVHRARKEIVTRLRSRGALGD